MKKALILIRHAHRDNSIRIADNGLSEKGLKQSKWIRKFAGQRFDQKEIHELKTMLLASPKKRCRETLEPLAELWQLKVEERKELDEMHDNESMADFQSRIISFKEWWIKQGPPLVFVSTHGDWLPLATEILLGSPVHMKKGSWLELSWDLGRCELLAYIPSFKIFYAG